MTTESLSREVDAHIVTILTRLSALKENNAEITERKTPMSVEARSLELWRAVAVECFATFLFSLIVSGAAAASAVSGSGLSVLATAVASGFAIAGISLIFGHVSGEKILQYLHEKIFKCLLREIIKSIIILFFVMPRIYVIVEKGNAEKSFLYA